MRFLQKIIARVFRQNYFLAHAEAAEAAEAAYFDNIMLSAAGQTNK